jgi:hypothetical protein
MTDFSTGFSTMRFRQSGKLNNRNYSMNSDMLRLFFALDENKTMSQVASQQQMDPAVMMECVSKLWAQGLIKPVGLTNLSLDKNFLKLLKINLHYIIGRKETAYACVNDLLEESGLSSKQLPAVSAPALVAGVASKISDPKIAAQFRAYMETVLPLRVKMREFQESDSMHQGKADAAWGSRGKTRQIIDRIIAARAGGNPIITSNIKTKLILKGINPDTYFDDTLDNPQTLEKLRSIAAAMGVDIDNQPLPGLKKAGTIGQIRRLILKIITTRSKGNPVVARNIRTKLFLKGINVDLYGPDTPDDPAVLDKVRKFAMTMGILS